VITTKPVRVLIADDQTLFRSGLARLLDDDPRVTVIAEAPDGVEAVRRCRDLEPDVVLMDIKMPNLDGIQATEQIVAACPGIPVLILTTFEADSHVRAALRAGPAATCSRTLISRRSSPASWWCAPESGCWRVRWPRGSWA